MKLGVWRVCMVCGDIIGCHIPTDTTDEHGRNYVSLDCGNSCKGNDCPATSAVRSHGICFSCYTDVMAEKGLTGLA